MDAPDPIDILARPGEPVRVPTGASYRFILGDAVFRVILRDDDGEPFAGKRYRLHVDRKTLEGTTGPAGEIEHLIPPGATEASVEAFLDDDAPGTAERWTIALAPLASIEDPTGIQQRLRNLGFYEGEITGALDDPTRDALAEFQDWIGHPDAKGELDEPTRAALAALSQAAAED